MHKYLRKYPIKTVSRRSSEHKIFANEKVLLQDMLIENRLSLNFDVNYDFEKEMVSISSTENKATVILHKSINNGDIQGVFLRNEYQFLPVRGKTVVDIGANIGDSSIYFALRGASKIIALEPFPVNYEAARKNVEFNNLSDKITVLLAGCAGHQGSIVIDREYKSEGGSSLHEFQSGIRIPLLTIEYILNEFVIPSQSILKVDCEGCEYDVILSSTPETLQRFSHIQIEYHYGYKNLKTKLETSGFQVWYDGPMRWNWEGRYQYLGFIYASRI